MRGHPSQPADVEESCTVLGRSVALKGRLVFTGTVRIDGHLEGEIQTTGDLEVGTGGVLKGIIRVGTLINRGKVQGKVTATDRVRLLDSSVLVGDVDTPLLSIEEGARFKGLCNRGSPVHDMVSDSEGRAWLVPPPGPPAGVRLIEARPSYTSVDSPLGSDLVERPQ